MHRHTLTRDETSSGARKLQPVGKCDDWQCVDACFNIAAGTGCSNVDIRESVCPLARISCRTGLVLEKGYVPGLHGLVRY